MVRFLRSIFGSCADRWFHEWQTTAADDHGHAQKRECVACGQKQTLVHYHSFAGADGPISSWENDCSWQP